MSINKFNIGIQSKIAVGRTRTRPFVVGYFQDTTQALAFHTAYELLMANNAKLSLSQSLVTVGNEELVSPQEVHDVYDVKVLCLWDSGNVEKSSIQTIFLPNCKYDVTDAEIEALVKLMVVRGSDGNDHFINKVISITKTPQNVASGGPTSEPRNPHVIP